MNCKNLYPVTPVLQSSSPPVLQQLRCLEAPKDVWGPNMTCKKIIGVVTLLKKISLKDEISEVTAALAAGSLTVRK